jgi:hypothetical protein
VEVRTVYIVFQSIEMDFRMSRYQWAEEARQHLAPVPEAASRLRTAVEASTERPPGSLPDPGSELLAASTKLSKWLDSVRVPIGMGRAHAELQAASGVLCNAAHAFRLRLDVREYRYQARLNACRSMLEQTPQHVGTFIEKAKSAVSRLRSWVRQPIIEERETNHLRVRTRHPSIPWPSLLCPFF